MIEQKNLFLAIGLSIAIIVIFQFLIPSQPIQKSNIENNEIIINDFYNYVDSFSNNRNQFYGSIYHQ